MFSDEYWKYKFYKDTLIMEILSCVMKSPKSAREISNECNIPLSTVYRKLKKLESKKLLQTSGTIDDAGVKIRLFNGVKNCKTA